MNCGNCLMEDVKFVKLVNDVCPKCGADYRTKDGSPPVERPCQLGDLVAGVRFVFANRQHEGAWIVTDHGDRDERTLVVQLSTGIAQQESNSTRVLLGPARAAK